MLWIFQLREPIKSRVVRVNKIKTIILKDE